MRGLVRQSRSTLMRLAIAACFGIIFIASISHSLDRRRILLKGGVAAVAEPDPATPFVNTTGLYTSPAALARFDDLATAGEPEATRRTSLNGASHGGLDWAATYDIAVGVWDGPGGACEPEGQTGSGDEYKLHYAAAHLYAKALSAEVQDSDAMRALVRSGLIEFTAITDLEAADLSGANQCILDASTAAPWLVEAALLLQGYSGWDDDDRLALATWLAEEVFPLSTWAAANRKNNWGAAGLGASVAISYYADGPITSLTKWDASTTTPAAYYLTEINTRLGDWLANSSTPLDSDCEAAVQNYGVQSTGMIPDEARRHSSGSDTAFCNEADLIFSRGCDGGTIPYDDAAECDGTSGAVFYTQKSVQLMARLCEALYTIEGDGDTCYELAVHGGANQTLYDMIVAATTSTGGTEFQDILTMDTTQGYRWMAGQYYGINKVGTGACITEALDDLSVSIQGGRDVPYAIITHGDGVRYETVPAACADTTPPADPTTVAASPGSTSISVSWDAPGEGDYSYSEVEYEADPASWPGTALSPDPTSSPASITGLTAETAYDIRVRHCDTSDNCSTSWVETTATTTAVSSFVTVEASGLSTALKARLPYNYASSTPLVDTSAWPERDVTTVGGTDPVGDSDFTSCSDIVGDGSDSTTAFRCMWANMAENECLYFPNGTYDFLTAGDFQHVLYYSNATDHRCVRGESEAGVELQFGRTYPTNPVVNFIAGDNSSGTVWGAAAVDWTSGFAQGTDEIVVDDASSFAEGEWVWLSANPNSLQVGGEAMDYQARVTDITSNTLTIDRPLPDDFTGTSPTARRWLPAEQISFENLTLTYNEPSHQLLLNNIMMWFRHTADSSFSTIHFKENYQYGVMVESSARIRGDTFKIDKVFDKAFNNYALSMNGSTDGLFNNFTIWNSTQGISCAGASQGNVFGFFAVMNTENNQPAFDRDCDGGTCDIVDHSVDHGTTVGAAYLHCSSGDEADASGTGGAANSCRGTRDDRMSGGILFHGASCSNSSFVRGYVEGGIWSDYLQGAGRNNLLFGLAIKPPAEDSTIPIVGGGMGNLGDIGFKDVGGVPNGGTYRNNFLLVGSNIDNLGTGGRNAFDAYMDEARVEHTLIRSTCRYDGGASPNAAADAACVDQTLEAGEVGGTLTWNDNEVGVGSSARTSTVVLPTAPGYTQGMLDALTGGSGTAPWYGADMGGDGGVGTNCSPAYMAYYGSCP